MTRHYLSCIVYRHIVSHSMYKHNKSVGNDDNFHNHLDQCSAHQAMARAITWSSRI